MPNALIFVQYLLAHWALGRRQLTDITRWKRKQNGQMNSMVPRSRP
jgi:hypothetical protein